MQQPGFMETEPAVPVLQLPSVLQEYKHHSSR